MAHIFMLDANDPLVFLPDIRSYNLYYGWYVGEWDQNDAWFDEFHKNHADAVIGLSEYGADANPRLPERQSQPRAIGARAIRPSTTSTCSKCGRSGLYLGDALLEYV